MKLQVDLGKTNIFLTSAKIIIKWAPGRINSNNVNKSLGKLYISLWYLPTYKFRKTYF